MGWFKRRREKQEQELRKAVERSKGTATEFYRAVTNEVLYPSLYMSELGRPRRIRSSPGIWISGSYSGLSGIGPYPFEHLSANAYVDTYREAYRPPVIEKMWKCRYCGSQFVSRVLSPGNGRETKPLVELKCPNCAGAICEE